MFEGQRVTFPQALFLINVVSLQLNTHLTFRCFCCSFECRAPCYRCFLSFQRFLFCLLSWVMGCNALCISVILFLPVVTVDQASVIIVLRYVVVNEQLILDSAG